MLGAGLLLLALLVALIVAPFHFAEGTVVEKMNLSQDLIVFVSSTIFVSVLLFFDKDVMWTRPTGPNVNVWGNLIDEDKDEQGDPLPRGLTSMAWEARKQEDQVEVVGYQNPIYRRRGRW